MGVESALDEPTDEATRTREASVRVGTSLDGKWHLDSLIAVGGMGAVYAATHRNGMRGAVKILDPHLGEWARRRFLREGRLANRVQHRGAVRVLDDDRAGDGSFYLVMELLEGSTLEDLAERAGGRLDAAAVVGWGLQVLDTLKEAHASGIVHRDIKPDNLFLTNDGIVKILDFGIAGMLRKPEAATLTRQGELVGTPAFLSPEQAHGRRELVDHQSDLFGLGASMYTLMTGELVHGTNATAAEMVSNAMVCQPPSLRDVMPDAPDALVRAIDGALELEKSDRWPDAAAMRAALEEADAAIARRKAHIVTGRRRRPRLGRLAMSVAVLALASLSESAAVPLGAHPAAGERSAAASTVAHATSGAAPGARSTSQRYDPIYDRRF